jgi:hypothetical protein
MVERIVRTYSGAIAGEYLERSDQIQGVGHSRALSCITEKDPIFCWKQVYVDNHNLCSRIQTQQTNVQSKFQ